MNVSKRDTSTGQKLEKKYSSILKIIKNPENFKLRGDELFHNSDNYKEIWAKSYSTAQFRKDFLCENGRNPTQLKKEKEISKELKPDFVIENLRTKKLYIIDFKSQAKGGSVDEKLQTGEYKIWIWKKIIGKELLQTKNYDIEWIWFLDEWFDSEKNRDVFEYIKKTEGCSYHMDKIPNRELNLPE